MNTRGASRAYVRIADLLRGTERGGSGRVRAFPLHGSPSAESAIRCGLALVEALAAIELPIRVGIHCGEVVMSADHIQGRAVHAAARVVAQSGAGEVFVSGTARELAEGATGLTFESRGRHRLKGLEQERELFVAGSSTG